MLKSIAETLRETCCHALVARYGGEEFAVLFADTSFAEAAATIETARARVEAKVYRLRESDAPLGQVTFSAGIVRARDGEALPTIVQRAYALLYAANDNGRNRLMREFANGQ